MLAELLVHRSEFESVNRAIPGVGHHRAAPRLVGRGRLIQTHELQSDRGNTAIYLVRDVRDVALSEYASTLRAGADWSFDRFLDPFLAGRLDTFGPWHRHVTHWLNGRTARKGNLLLLRYEDLRSDPGGHLSLVARFLGLEATADWIEAAVEANSIEAMRAKERRAPEDTFVKVRRDMTFVREGRTGGWRAALTRRQIDRIGSATGPILARLGYETPERVR
jgi:hypothetical protein